jgi:MarR family transcriptional regulator, organic hydroperoxide resistance regulator
MIPASPAVVPGARPVSRFLISAAHHYILWNIVLWNAVDGVMTDLKELFSQLIRLETELWDAIDARLRAECGLPLGWFEAMQTVGRGDLCRVQDIAGELAITVGGTSKLVDRIEADGLCQRRPNPGDRRSSIVELTPAGHRLLGRADGVFGDELARRIGSVLPPGQLERFGAALAELRAAGHRSDRTERTA